MGAKGGRGTLLAKDKREPREGVERYWLGTNWAKGERGMLVPRYKGENGGCGTLLPGTNGGQGRAWDAGAREIRVPK